MIDHFQAYPLLPMGFKQVFYPISSETFRFLLLGVKNEDMLIVAIPEPYCIVKGIQYLPGKSRGWGRGHILQ